MLRGSFSHHRICFYWNLTTDLFIYFFSVYGNRSDLRSNQIPQTEADVLIEDERVAPSLMSVYK